MISEYSVPPFINKGYYVPLVLSNGVDFCQLDFSGSMSWEEQIKGYLSYWYKKGRPNSADPLGIIKVIYKYLSPRGSIESGQFSQHFDPKTAHLYTHLEFFRFELEVETWLSDDHTLVEMLHIVKAEDSEAGLRFALYCAERCYTGKLIDVLKASKGQIETLVNDNGLPYIAYNYGNEFRGLAVSNIRVLKGSARRIKHRIYKETSTGETNIVLAGVQTGDIILRATTVIDSLDTPNFENDAWRTNSHYLNDYQTCSEIHKQKWKEYQNSSTFSCPLHHIERLFYTSLYVCKASLHPNGSTVSALAIPNNHGMGTYWDVWFTHRALLATNHVKEAEGIVNFWKASYHQARRWAKEKYGVGGARFGWVLKYDGTSFDGEQIHNNIIPLINIWDQYLFTMNKKILEDSYNLMEDSIRFIIEYALKKNGGKPYLKELICIDESSVKQKNELITVVITLRGLSIIKKTSEVLGREVSQDLLEAEDSLHTILDSLHMKDGHYAPYLNGEVGGWVIPLAFIHSPNLESFTLNIDLALKECKEEYGLGIGHSKSRVATMPWSEGIFAWSMVRNSDSRAIDYWMNMMRFTNFHGGFAESLFPYGEPSRDWFVAAHGCYLIVLCEILVQMKDNTMRIMPLGMDALPFKKFRVKNLLLEGAWRFSEELSLSGTLLYEITNLMQQKRSLDIVMPDGKRNTILLEGHTSFKGQFLKNYKRT